MIKAVSGTWGWLLFSFISILYSFQSVNSGAGEMPGIPKTAADMLMAESGISLFRYGVFGLGAYPYRYSFPGAVTCVRIDGVPLRSLSPFGPDLERIPAEFVGSVGTDQWRNIALSTPVIKEKQPETRTSFFLGQRRRFRFHMLFQKQINERNGIIFGGSSAGMHGNESIKSSSSRNYLMKYIRTLNNDSSLNFCLRGSRDRDSLNDLENQSPMGHRETDDISLSIGLQNYRLGKRTVFLPIVYCNRSISRFRRYGYTKSVEDNALGLSANLSTKRGNSIYSLDVSHDILFFDSRIHDVSWTRYETDMTGSFTWIRKNFRMNMKTGILSSSKYGLEPTADGSITLMMKNACELIIRGSFTGEFPDPGTEYYPSLVFSDTSRVSDLDAYRNGELESGIDIGRGNTRIGLFGFISSGRKCMFVPRIPGCLLSNSEHYSGGRIIMEASKENRYHLDCTATFCNTMGRTESQNNQESLIWPYPELEAVGNGNLYRKLIHGLVDGVFFSKVRFSRWSGGPVTPDGDFFFIDCGISAVIKSLELFYRIENITGEDIKWFDSFRWEGRNAMWGVQWKFMD